ncbi:AraC family transcriptional regulator [Haliea sp. E1-2-M8]|uniref:AraC family transcriptional regulator n=1 Tax=Haliea sp. E1-2-M8 TaxID=3064706 RepID=UPI002720DAA2|nr:AraC family transcriptional regulator [Haliea sp. E1-2-M8]MDO8861754.1 AraC family transcriptional regulator [Haliea sp. E1-2-M8]
MPRASAPAQYILILIDMVENRGYPRQRLLAGTSLAQSGLTGIGARVSEEDFSRVVSNAFDLTGDTALGLHLGLRLNLSAHAVLGQAFMTCRDLGQVMELFLRYYHLLSSPTLHLEQDVIDGRCVLTTVSPPRDNPVEFASEVMYAAIFNTLRGLLGRNDLQLRVELPYPPPVHEQIYHEVFGEDVHFNCPLGRISFDAALLSTPLPLSNPALRSLYEEECARLLADLEEGESVAEQTLRLLRKLEGQYPQMPQLAQMLNFSPRTYRRRLGQESTSYQHLLDRVRAEHATRYLQNSRLPLSTIAYLVGFNDASNFRRAYQKWTGRAPRELRVD